MTTVNDSTKRFADVPVEYDTTILSQVESEIEGIPVLVESSHWDDGNYIEVLALAPDDAEGASEPEVIANWGGFYIESLIFVSADVEDKDDEALEALARASGRVKGDSSLTIKRNTGGYTFVNFNVE
jgi:hypothetical protein